MTWLSILALLALLLLIGLARERFRLPPLRSWAQAKGLALEQPAPQSSLALLGEAQSLLGRQPIRQIGLVLSGQMGEKRLCIAELRLAKSTQNTSEDRWCSLMVVERDRAWEDATPGGRPTLLPAEFQAGWNEELLCLRCEGMLTAARLDALWCQFQLLLAGPSKLA
jgi:hypothetical protein